MTWIMKCENLKLALLINGVCTQSKRTAEKIKFMLDKMETIFFSENTSYICGFFLQISVDNLLLTMGVSTFIYLPCNLIGFFFSFVLFALYYIEDFGKKTSVQHHSSYFIFPLLHFYMKMVQKHHKATRMLLLKQKTDLEISHRALSLSFK